MIVEECMKWSTQRNVFGKPLIQQPVIRFKLGQMIADVEAVHSMLEDMTHQMVTMSEGEINTNLAGPIALLKYKQTRVATMISDHACQIFGGRVSTPSSSANGFHAPPQTNSTLLRKRVAQIFSHIRALCSVT